MQYLAWLAPWVAELGWAPAVVFYAASGVFLFLVYNYWAQGLPWYLADAIDLGDYPGRFDHAQLICWFSVVLAAGAVWHRPSGISKDWPRLLPFPPLTPRVRIACGLAMACALLWIVPPADTDASRPCGKSDEKSRAGHQRGCRPAAFRYAGGNGPL